MSIKLGQKVRDLVTLTEGIVTARAEYLNGCIRYCLEPQVTDPSKVVETVTWCDEQQVEVIDEGVRDKMGMNEVPEPTVRLRSATGGPPRNEAPRG